MAVPPADAFGLLGSEVRVAILQALADGTHPDTDRRTLAFSEIHDRVDVGDTGRLNYHLDELVGHFVRRTDEGYRLRYAGWKVVWAIRAGTFHQDASREFDAPGTCYDCGQRALRARTRNGWLSVRCGDCDALHTANPLPPSALADRSPEDLLRAFDAVVRHRVSLVADRICPECSGPMRATIEEDVPAEWDVRAIPRFRCENCAYWFHPPFGALLLEHSETGAFLRRHGIDADERPYWDLELFVDPDVAVESRDPWRITVAVESGGERLRATFDGDAELREITADG